MNAVYEKIKSVFHLIVYITEDGTANVNAEEEETVIKVQGEFNVSGAVENSITLDKCDYCFVEMKI